MVVDVHIYDCYQYTYRKCYRDVVERCLLYNGIKLTSKDIVNIVIDVVITSKGSKDNIQAKRMNCSRIMRIYIDGNLRFLVGFSNTNYDEDKRLEGGKYEYGKSNYHANSFMIQGLTRIFNEYINVKSKFLNVSLYFYILDTDKSYSCNLFNLFTYRRIATIGFHILNIDVISFDAFENRFRLSNSNDIRYKSFIHYYNDSLWISKRNSGNTPSYLKIVENDENIEEFVFVFKTLSATQYDSMLSIITIYLLAQKEGRNVAFELSQDLYGYKAVANKVAKKLKIAKSLTDPVLNIIKVFIPHFSFVTNNEILQQSYKNDEAYKEAKNNNNLRNQSLLRNNMLKKGMPIKCCLCGCEIDSILEAAHLWSVSDIKNASEDEINRFVSLPSISLLLEPNDRNYNDVFYKKYIMATSGDNAIWLCRNHHRLFDMLAYTYSETDGKLTVSSDIEETIRDYINNTKLIEQLDDDVLTERTKEFLSKANKFRKKLKKVSSK